MTGQGSLEGPRRSLEALLLAVAALFGVLLYFEVRYWHPGFADLDEGFNVAYLQEWLEGRALPLELFKGCFHRDSVAAFVALFGPSLWDFRLLAALALLLENILLYRLARRRFQAEVAALAVLVNLVSSFTFLRSRSLLSYCILPAELLSFEALMAASLAALPSFLWGFGAACLLLDYEAWLFALPILLVLWLTRSSTERPGAFWASLGFLLGLCLVLYLSWDSLGTFLQTRARSLTAPSEALWRPPLDFMAAFFYSTASGLGYLGVTGHSIFPSWALPGLLLGFWRARRESWLWLWALLGILPGLSIAGAAEPNRILAAWPALCVLAAWGIWEALQRVNSKNGRDLLLLILIAAGLANEGWAYWKSMEEAWPAYYAKSAAYGDLALRYAGRPLVNELGDEIAPAWRFAWPRPSPGAPVLYVLSPNFTPALATASSKGQVQLCGPEMEALWVLDAAPPALGTRLDGVAFALERLRLSLPRFDYRERRYLLEETVDNTAEPWVRTAALEQALRYSSSLGDIDPRLAQQALKLPLVSSSALLWLASRAEASQNEALAQAFCTRAQQIDPRRPCGESAAP